MKAKSKIDIVYKYGTPRKVQVKITEAERIESKLAGREKTHKTIEVLPNFCKAGEYLTIISDNPGAWMIALICENSLGWRVPVLWTDLIVDNG